MLIPLRLGRLARIAQSFLRLRLLLIPICPISSCVLILFWLSTISSSRLIVFDISRILRLSDGYQISTNPSLPWCFFMLYKFTFTAWAYGWGPLDQSCLTKTSSGFSSIHASSIHTFLSRLSFVRTPVVLL